MSGSAPARSPARESGTTTTASARSSAASASRYSPLAQIHRGNAAQLRVAWRWQSPDAAVRERARLDPSYANQSTPLMAGGTLFVSTSLSQAAALDPATGATRWIFDPKIHERHPRMPANNGWLHRGLAYWADGERGRVILLTAHAWMIALDARSGRPVESFGEGGWVDLAKGLRRAVVRDDYTMTSPPVIVNDVIVVKPPARS